MQQLMGRIQNQSLCFSDQQMVATENEEGLSTKDEKEDLDPADGQDPYETAKRNPNYLKGS